MCLEYLSAYADEISYIDHFFHEFVCAHPFFAAILDGSHQSLIIRHQFAVVAMEHELDLSGAVQ